MSVKIWIAVFKVKVMAVVKVTVRAYNIYNQNMTFNYIL